MKKLICLLCVSALPSVAPAAEPPIIEAVRGGDKSRLRELAKAKSGVNARGSQRQTALHEAASACSLEAAQILTAAGIDTLIRDSAGRTAAMIAMECQGSAERNQLIHLLMPPDETTPWSLQDAAARGHLDVVNMLLKLGSDVNAIGTKGNRALEVACRSGNPAVAKALLDHGADVRLRTNAGTTVLHEAALGGSSEIVEMLLDKGVAINAPDTESGSTPLYYAASFGRMEAVRALLRRGAGINRRNNRGMTAMDTARANSQNDVLALLQQAQHE